jgi:hypothetical protein
MVGNRSNGRHCATYSLIGCGCLIALFIGTALASFTYTALTHFLHANSKLILAGRTFVSKVGNDDIKGAYSMISSKWREHDSPNAIRLYLTDWRKSQGAVTKIEFNGMHYNSDAKGSWAILNFIVVGSKKRSDVSVIMGRESNNWKVQACNVVWLK